MNVMQQEELNEQQLQLAEAQAGVDMVTFKFEELMIRNRELEMEN